MRVLVRRAAVLAVAAALGRLAWAAQAIPAGLLVAWLVACRLMVRHERGEPVARQPRSAMPDGDQADVPESSEQTAEPTAETWADDAPTGSTPAIADPSLWDPMPVTLPTYVGKPAAERRSVRTIDLDSTGVWTSGRTEADAQIAREADDAARSARSGRKDDDGRRAVNS